MISRISTATLGLDKRGKPRCYLQGRWLAKLGLERGAKVRVSYHDGLVVVSLDEAGSRRVSGKGEVPVVDLQGDELGSALAGYELLEVRASSGRVVIRPSRVEEQKRKRTKNGLEGSIFSGGGLMTQAAKLAGFKPAFAVELEDSYAEIFERNHSGALVCNTSVHEVRLDDLQHVELLTVGLCCEPFSKKRRNQGSDLPPEAHPNGDLVVWALRVVDAVNPRTIVVEEVPEFLDSGAGWILHHALVRMGYTVDARVLDPADYGELAGRKRAILVASSEATINWPEPQPRTRRLGEVLESDGDWFDAETKPWLFNHWQKQTAKGNRFFEGRQILDAQTERVPCISKRYFSQQGDGVVVRHPTREGVFRWLSVGEVKKLMGLDASYDLGPAKTTAGEVLGQGVQVGLLRQVIEAVTRK